MKFQRYLIISMLPILLAAVTARVTAQSADQSLPTPVLANEVEGRIAPLDLGDPRLTRHFYAFEGTPGDLIITVNSRNLNGDMDVFTAVTFRPLMKISIYANTIPPEVTKSIYLRTKQILILRVEARLLLSRRRKPRRRLPNQRRRLRRPQISLPKKSRRNQDLPGTVRPDLPSVIRAGVHHLGAPNRQRQKRKLLKPRQKNLRRKPTREKRSPPSALPRNLRLKKSLRPRNLCRLSLGQD